MMGRIGSRIVVAVVCSVVLSALYHFGVLGR